MVEKEKCFIMGKSRFQSELWAHFPIAFLMLAVLASAAASFTVTRVIK
jgi:hypothetical protein